MHAQNVLISLFAAVVYFALQYLFAKISYFAVVVLRL
jgi:hypothetical protein